MTEFNAELCASERQRIEDHHAQCMVEVRGLLIDIKDQTTKHNGRMTALERWKSRSNGAAATIIIMVPILTAVLVWVLQKGL